MSQLRSGQVIGSRQFKTGEIIPGDFMPEEAYESALDNLVIGCVDVAVVSPEGTIFLGLRTQEPYPGWWIIGGRQRRGELFEESAMRTLHRELGLHIIDPQRFLFLSFDAFMWDTRAQKPVHNGCHMLDVVEIIFVTKEELRTLRPNAVDYHDYLWIPPSAIIERKSDYHPALVKWAGLIEDLLSQQNKQQESISG